MTAREKAMVAILARKVTQAGPMLYEGEGWRFQVWYDIGGGREAYYQSKPHPTREDAERVGKRLLADAMTFFRKKLREEEEQQARRHLPTTNMILPEPPEATGQN